MSIVPLALGAFLVLIVVSLVRSSARRHVRQTAPYATPPGGVSVRPSAQPRRAATAVVAVLLSVAILTAVTAAVLLVDDAMQTRVEDPFDPLPAAPGAAR